jgi:hypothetical protein
MEPSVSVDEKRVARRTIDEVLREISATDRG